MPYRYDPGCPCCKKKCKTPAGDALERDTCDGSLPLTMKFIILEVRGANRYVEVAGCPSLSWPNRFLLKSTDGINWTRKTAGDVSVSAKIEKTNSTDYWRASEIIVEDADHKITFVGKEGDDHLYLDQANSTCGDCSTQVRWWIINTARILPEESYQDHTFTLTGSGHATLPEAPTEPKPFDCNVYNGSFTLTFMFFGLTATIYDGWVVAGTWYGEGGDPDGMSWGAGLSWDQSGNASVFIIGHWLSSFGPVSIHRRSFCVPTDAESGTWPHAFDVHQQSPNYRNPCVGSPPEFYSWCTCGSYTVSG